MKRFCLVVLLLLASAAGIRSQVITAYNIDNTILVDGTHYACSDVGIDAALAALPSSVGTVIVPGCQGSPVPISSTITIGYGQTLLLNSGTNFQPQSAGMTMFSIKAGATLKGLYADVSNQPSFTGRVVSLTDNYRDSTHTTVKDITCTGGPTTTVAGACIWLSAGDVNTQSIAFVTVDNVHAVGFYSAVAMTTIGTGFINGNLFSNIHVSEAVIGFAFNATGGSISGNLFSNVSYQCCAAATTSYGMFLEGSGGVSQNTFSGFTIWDTISPNVPILVNTSSVVNNLFVGRVDGAISDPHNQNQYFVTGPSSNGYVVQNVRTAGAGILVGQLPSAAANPGQTVYVTDSTSVSPPSGSEGQTCVGGSSNKALAFSNGVVWKCF